MVKKRIRKMIRRVIRWAFRDEKGQCGIAPVYHVAADVRLSQSKAEDILIRGLSTPGGRKVIVNTIKTARINRELKWQVSPEQ